MRSVGSHVYGTGLGGPDCGPADGHTLCGNPVSLERRGLGGRVKSPGLHEATFTRGSQATALLDMHTLA